MKYLRAFVPSYLLLSDYTTNRALLEHVGWSVGIVREVHHPLDGVPRHRREEEGRAEEHDEQQRDEERADGAHLATLRRVKAGLNLVGLAARLEAEDRIAADLRLRGRLLAFACVWCARGSGVSEGRGWVDRGAEAKSPPTWPGALFAMALEG